MLYPAELRGRGNCFRKYHCCFQWKQRSLKQTTICNCGASTAGNSFREVQIIRRKYLAVEVVLQVAGEGLLCGRFPYDSDKPVAKNERNAGRILNTASVSDFKQRIRLWRDHDGRCSIGREVLVVHSTTVGGTGND